MNIPGLKIEAAEAWKCVPEGRSSNILFGGVSILSRYFYLKFRRSFGSNLSSEQE